MPDPIQFDPNLANILSGLQAPSSPNIPLPRRGANQPLSIADKVMAAITGGFGLPSGDDPESQRWGALGGALSTGPAALAGMPFALPKALQESIISKLVDIVNSDPRLALAARNHAEAQSLPATMIKSSEFKDSGIDPKLFFNGSSSNWTDNPNFHDYRANTIRYASALQSPSVKEQIQQAIGNTTGTDKLPLFRGVSSYYDFDPMYGTNRGPSSFSLDPDIANSFHMGMNVGGEVPNSAVLGPGVYKSSIHQFPYFEKELLVAGHKLPPDAMNMDVKNPEYFNSYLRSTDAVQYQNPKKPWQVFDPREGHPIAEFSSPEEAQAYIKASGNDKLDYSNHALPLNNMWDLRQIRDAILGGKLGK